MSLEQFIEDKKRYFDGVANQEHHALIGDEPTGFGCYSARAELCQEILDYIKEKGVKNEK